MYCSQAPSRVRCTTAAGPASLSTHFLGPHPLIEYYLNRLNVEGILRSHIGMGREGILDHGKALCVLIHNILTSPGPLYRLANWAEPIEPSSLGLTPEQKAALNDDRMARALDALGSERARGIWFRLALRAIKQWKLSVDRVHFDTTTVTFHGEYAGSVREPQIRHGHNKDHRPDLKQLVFGLNVVSDGAVPLLHQVASGHRPDDTLHKGNYDRLRVLLGRTDFIYVADSKLATTENMAYVAGHHGKFVTVLPRSRREDKEMRNRLRAGGVRWKRILVVPNRRRKDDPPDVFSTLVGGEEKTAEGYRLIWYRSSLAAQQDAEIRLRDVRKAELALHALAETLARARRKAKTRRQVRAAVDGILKDLDAVRFIDVKLTQSRVLVPRRFRPGKPRKDDPIRMEVRKAWKVHFERNEQALQAEARTDGVFPLVCHNLDGMSRREVLEVYKYQPYLEKRFSQIKSELEIAPEYLKKPHRAAALLDVHFIAIAVGALLERDLRQAMERTGTERLPLFPEGRTTQTPTAPRILEAFASAAWHEFRRGKETICFPLQLNQLQRKLLRLLEAPLSLYR